MPHLDVSTYASQLFWLVICFSFLYFFISFVIMPKLTEMINKRQNMIDEHLKEAAKMKENADIAFKKYEDALEQAKETSRISYEESLKKLNETIDQKQSILQKELSKELKTVEEKLEKSKEIAIKEALAISENLSKEIISKLGIK